ncbi:BTAD domain-containing putative transcriptional regulator [Actinomadura sp. 9N215]|uniref:AfsR/SARP family transcriptional regulator n=1 Tax=Actinomadura sp. 9N215 TaxID=3375150 RepID=UPI0037ACE1CE
MRLEFRILGPLAIDHGGKPVIIKSRRQRVILSLLLLQPNHVVSTERLIDALWEHEPPATARAQIHVCVSALRARFAEVGEPDMIGTRPPGYLIAVDDDAVDAQRFEALVAAGRSSAADGRPEAAIARFTEALALWRDEALAGSGSPLVESAAVGLGERRAAVEEECMALELEMGRYADVLAKVVPLAARYPLREGLRLTHMRALYRAGRRAEALEVYQDARRLFIDEIGIEPGPELRELEETILAEDRAADPARDRPGAGAGDGRSLPIVPRQLPAPVADFTGREQLLAGIDAVLTDVSDGPTPVVVITGAAGTGKTAVALRAAHQAASAFPDGQLFIDLHSGDLWESDDTASRVLGRFLRALGAPPAMIPADVEERAKLYRSFLAGRRLLVVLDDVRAEEQVLPLLPGGGNCAVIMTSKSRLSRLPGAHRMEVGTFDAREATEFLRKSIDAGRMLGDPQAAQDIIDLCGGIPIALRIVTAKLAARPHWSLSYLTRLLGNEKDRLNHLLFEELDVRSNLSLAYRNLHPRTQVLYRRIGLLGHSEFPAWVTAALTDTSPEEAGELRDQLAEARLIDITAPARGDGELRCSMLSLIRDFARERLMDEESPQSRTDTARRVAGVWLALAQEAHRRTYGGDFATVQTIEERWPYGADALTRILAEPRGWFQTEHPGLVAAVRLAADHGLDELCWNLALASATCFEAEGLYDDWERTHEIALRCVRAAGNRHGEAAVLYSLGSLGVFRGHFTVAAEHLAEAMALFRELGSDHGSALAMRNLAYIDRLKGRYEHALERYEDALAALRKVDDRAVEAHVLSNIAAVHLDTHNEDAADALLNQAAAICEDLPNKRLLAQVRHRFGELYLHVGLNHAAERSFESVLALVREADDPVGITHALYGLGLARTADRRYAQARADFEEGFRLAGEAGDPFAAARIALAYGRMLSLDDSEDEAARWLWDALTTFRTIGAPLWQARALGALDELSLDVHGRSRVEDARRELQRLLEGIDVNLDPDLERLMLR